MALESFPPGLAFQKKEESNKKENKKEEVKNSDHEAVFSFDATIQEVVTASRGDDIIDWGLHTIMAPVAWEKTKGERVKVAVLDTGVDVNHPDLKENIVATANFTNSPHGVRDLQGHGTHVAGIIAGSDNGRGIVGVAPKAELYIAKVLGDNGGGSVDGIVKGIRWAVSQGVDIINMSLGANVDLGGALHETIRYAHKEGVIIIAATGNENSNVCWPAMYDEVLAVSAMNNMYDRANFSNYGIKNEIIAPGVEILSAYKDGKYARLSGTSMATPIIAGSAALLLSYMRKHSRPVPNVEFVHERLQRATVDLGKDGRDQFFGVGLINLAKLF